MPTLIRLVVFLALLAVLGFVAMFVLANFVGPNQRDISIDVPVDRVLR